MAIDTGVKLVVDAIMGVLKNRKHARLKRNAEKAVREAIRELLLANPNENEAQARIAAAKAANLISSDVLLAEQMLKKVRDGKRRTVVKKSSSRRRVKKKKSVRRKNKKKR